MMADEVNPLHQRSPYVHSPTPSATSPSHWKTLDSSSSTSKLLGQQYNNQDLDESNQLPVHTAAYMGKYSILSELLNRGTKSQLEERDSNGNTILHYACEGGDRSLGCVALLLQNKLVDKNAVNDLGHTPLHICASRGFESTMQALLLSGVKRDVGDAEGNTAMHLAGEARQLRCVELLVASGASVSAKNRQGLTAADITPQMDQALCTSQADCCVLS